MNRLNLHRIGKAYKQVVTSHIVGGQQATRSASLFLNAFWHLKVHILNRVLNSDKNGSSMTLSSVPDVGCSNANLSLTPQDHIWYLVG